ncbi:MAG: hypothetical protein HY062_04110 [Bacteroidetes bacterium]|nr:hypothetical protein [Bacteroidota bacterium]
MTFKLTSVAAAIVIIAACHSTKKTATASSTPAPAATATNPSATATAPAKPNKGINAPTDQELTAILTKYPDATLPVLTEGYQVYTGEACTACHSAKGIYRIPEREWPGIIDDMSKKAKITDSQKDALTKYVFAIKATQPTAPTTK